MSGQEFAAETGYPVFYRTYSRRKDGDRESYQDVCDRAIGGLAELGNLTEEEIALLKEEMEGQRSLPSGRWMWIGGTEWSKQPENYPGSYNCCSTNVLDWQSFGLMMDLAMQGTGTGAVLEQKFISQLPPIRNQIEVIDVKEIGTFYNAGLKQSTTEIKEVQDSGETILIIEVGDSRQGWVSAYQSFLELASSDRFNGSIKVCIELGYVRPSGEPLKGFGGIANPSKLPELFPRLAKILNRAIGRQLTAEECCLLIDEAALVVVAGNIRRSAGIRQFESTAPLLKTNLWREIDGEWKIDPDKDALRMANHTRVYHHKPTEQECIDAVREQFRSGEGAIQNAVEAIARSNADLLDTEEKKKLFIQKYNKSLDEAKSFLRSLSLEKDPLSDVPEKDLEHRMQRLGLNPCAEIIGSDLFCNLGEIHLNRIDPFDLAAQERAFKAAAISVAVLLNHKFSEPRYRYSRELDPIVGVSITGLFDFFVKAFGADWLKWWEAGRPENWNSDDALQNFHRIIDWLPIEWNLDKGMGYSDRVSHFYQVAEQYYLKFWKKTVHETVWGYCDRHGLKRPNRCTTGQPAGTKSLLTGASSGWAPPKAQRYIRRITFAKNDPVALACIDYGYSVVPSQSDKDEAGNLLNDPFDPRCTEWLVEIPVEMSWASLPGADSIHIEKFSALAQFDFYMQVQRYYTAHNCFSRDTEFLTAQGIASFEKFNPGDVVSVLNRNGDWVEATVVRTSDLRLMYEIRIREGKTGREKTIVATECHRFPVRRLSCGESAIKILTTKELKPGHRMVINAADLPDIDEEGIRHGIAFGDGSLYKNSAKEYVGCQLYLCGAKRQLQIYFDGYDRTYEKPEIDQTRIYGLPVHYKTLPGSDCSQSYLAGFVAGLLATDGNITRSTISIATGRQEVVDFLWEQLPRIGIKATSSKWYESNSYKQGGGAYQVLVSKSTFPENLILRPHHLDEYQSHDSQPCQWRVVSIHAKSEKEYGWCVMEPETNHFTLKDNILVMNTSATIELTEEEIEPLGKRIYQAIADDEGYISTALLARFDAPFPRLPFEKIDKETYDRLHSEVLQRRKVDDFHEALRRHDLGVTLTPEGPAGCDSDKCLMPGLK